MRGGWSVLSQADNNKRVAVGNLILLSVVVRPAVFVAFARSDMFLETIECSLLQTIHLLEDTANARCEALSLRSSPYRFWCLFSLVVHRRRPGGFLHLRFFLRKMWSCGRMQQKRIFPLLSLSTQPLSPSSSLDHEALCRTRPLHPSPPLDASFAPSLSFTGVGIPAGLRRG